MNELEKQAFLNSLWQAARARAAAAGPAVKAFGQSQMNQARSLVSTLQKVPQNPMGTLKAAVKNPLARNLASIGVGAGVTKATDSGTAGFASGAAANVGLKALTRRF